MQTWICVLILLLFGCGDDEQRPDASTDASSETDARWEGVPACESFGLGFSSGCADCAPVSCPCLSEPLDNCSFGRCVRQLDCDAVCSAAAEDGGAAFGRFRACLAAVPCEDDRGCVGGLCREAFEGKRCTQADELWDCSEDAECFSGICVNRCQSGGPNGSCENDKDCKDGRCLPGQLNQPGVCTRGQPGEPCMEDGDCAKGTCYRHDGDLSPLGACQRGEPGSGAAGSGCRGDDECPNATCEQHNIPVSFAGACTDRKPGAECNADEHCASGRCALQTADDNRGLCSEGKSGDPCHGDDDCSGLRCQRDQSGEQIFCNWPGEPCGFKGAGTCGGNHRCELGVCAK